MPHIVSEFRNILYNMILILNALATYVDNELIPTLNIDFILMLLSFSTCCHRNIIELIEVKFIIIDNFLFTLYNLIVKYVFNSRSV